MRRLYFYLSLFCTLLSAAVLISQPALGMALEFLSLSGGGQAPDKDTLVVRCTADRQMTCFAWCS